MNLNHNGKEGKRVGNIDDGDSFIDLDNNKKTNGRVTKVGAFGIDTNTNDKVTGLGKKLDLCKSQVLKATNKVVSYNGVDNNLGVLTDMLENLYDSLSSFLLDSFSPLILLISFIPVKPTSDPGNQNLNIILAFFYKFICSFDYKALF